VKPPAFDYVAPSRLDDAVKILAADEDARALAGGQSLVPMLSFRLTYPSLLVGLRSLPSLRNIEQRGDQLAIGAMVTQQAALSSPAVGAACPLVHQALGRIGHPQIRSRGTVGGSLAHADPAAELPAALLALGGAVAVHGESGSRVVPAEDLFLGHYTTSLAAGEIITEALFPSTSQRTGAACLEITRRPGDFAMVGAVCQITLNEEGTIAAAHVALFAVSDVPLRLPLVEESLTGSRPGDDVWQTAAQLAADGLDPAGATSEDRRYRQRVVPTVVRRSLAEAARRAGVSQ
jgi:aerobic carbon-monoxide dehydrogenase medium subunit